MEESPSGVSEDEISDEPTKSEKQGASAVKTGSHSITIVDRQPKDNAQINTFLVGDSLLRPVRTLFFKNGAVRTMPGARIRDISDFVSTIQPRSYTSVYLLVGRNDCASRYSKTSQMVNDYSDLIDSAKNITDDVYVISVPPRLDKDLNGRKIQDLNNAMSKLCADKSVHFLDYFRQFWLDDKSLDRPLLADDGFHLSDKGVQLLLRVIENATPGVLSTSSDFASNTRESRYPRQQTYALATGQSSRPRPPQHTVQQYERVVHSPPKSREAKYNTSDWPTPREAHNRDSYNNQRSHGGASASDGWNGKYSQSDRNRYDRHNEARQGQWSDVRSHKRRDDGYSRQEDFYYDYDAWPHHVRCWWCGDSMHSSGDCVHRRDADCSYRGSEACRHCGNYGHRDRDCALLSNQYYRLSNISDEYY